MKKEKDIIIICSMILILSIFSEIIIFQNNFTFEQNYDAIDLNFIDLSSYSSKGLANSTFPMFKGDIQRTGRCNVDTSDNPGMIKWTFQDVSSITTSSPIVGEDGVIYYGTDESHFYAVYPNGTLKWKFDTGSAICASGVLDDKGCVYFGSQDGYFYCIYTSNGTQKWRNNKGVSYGSPVISEDIIYLISRGELVALYTNATIIWSNKNLNMYVSSPTLGHDGTIYVGSYDNYLYAVYPNNGTVKWGFKTGDYVSTTPAIDRNDSIYFGCWDDYFYALYPNGTLKWKDYRPGTKEAWYCSPVIDFNNEILVVDPWAYLCRYNENGTLLKEWQTQDLYAPPTIDRNNIIYMVEDRIIATYPNHTLHMYMDPIETHRTSPVFGPDGTVYVLDSSATLTALGKKVPNKPSLFLTSSGNGYVNIKWSIVEDVNSPGLTSIKIMRRSSSDGFSMISILNGSNTGYNDTEVINGMNYEYTVIAVNKYGESEQSNIVSAIPMTNPDAPSNLRIRSGNGFIEISWAPPDDKGGSEITGYHLWKRKNDEMNFSIIFEFDNDTFIYNDTEVFNGRSYYYYVLALNSIGPSIPSQVVSAVPMTIPSPPIFDLQEDKGFVILNWLPPASNGGSEITSWRIYRGQSADSKELLINLNVSLSTYNDTSINNGTTYYYHMTCFNSVGESSPSNTLSVTPKGVPSPPLQLKARTGDKFVHLTWSEPERDQGSPILGYIVHASETVNGTLLEYTYNIDNGTITEYNDTIVQNGNEYTYYVVSFNAIGRSCHSNEVLAIPMGLPSVPINVSATIEGDNVVLTWDAPINDGGSQILSYNIYRKISEGPSSTYNVLVREFVDVDAPPRKLITYQISAINTVGEGALCQLTSIMIEINVPPSEPIELKAELIRGGVRLTWLPPIDSGGSEILGYRIYKRSVNISDYQELAVVQDREYTDSSVDIDWTYAYKVCAYNSIGNGTFSNETSIFIDKAPITDEDHEWYESIILWILLIIIIILVVSLILFLLLIKRTKKEEQIEPTPDQESIKEPTVEKEIFSIVPIQDSPTSETKQEEITIPEYTQDE